jgi:Thymidylate synthase
MHIAGNSMNEIYKQACRMLFLHGSDVGPRGLMTRELTNVQIELSDPRARIASSTTRDMSMRYMVGELCFYLNGSTDLETIAYYGPFWRKVSDDDKTVNSAYGLRLFFEGGGGQFNYAIHCLNTDVDSRKAVMPIYRLTDSKTSKDNPCTMFLQLMIRQGRLNCYVFMRSNDIWLGLPYDLAFFTFLQEMAFVTLRRTYPELQLGHYLHHATSLHCYADHIDDLQTIANEANVEDVRMPHVTNNDVRTWFPDLLHHEHVYRTGELCTVPTAGIQGWLLQWLR